jgi:hypothetical protein
MARRCPSGRAGKRLQPRDRRAESQVPTDNEARRVELNVARLPDSRGTGNEGASDR